LDQKVALEFDASESRLGDGEFPSSLDRLNWAAVLWGGYWALVYGAWPWLLGLVALTVVDLIVYYRLVSIPDVSPVLAVGIVVVERVVWLAVVISLGYRANRLVWESERARVARQSDQSVPRLAQPVTRYEAAQVTWAWIGLACTALAIIVNVADARTGRRELIVAVYATMAVGLIALFAYERIRSSRPRAQS